MCVSGSAYLSTWSPFASEMIGITINAKEFGIAVFKQVSVGFLSFEIEYLKKVPMANDIKIMESTIPKNKSPIENFSAMVCLLKLYVVLIIWTIL